MGQEQTAETPDKGRVFDASLALRERFNAVIPGGAHTYAKGDDQWPEFAAPYIERGSGCHVWDVDGNEYIEYGMGLRSVTLGHAFEPVDAAVRESLSRGMNFVRPSVLELEAAERFVDMIEGAEMVKFAKNGSDVTTAALKLARAWTGRTKVAICANHPFFSVDDWFIGTTAINSGVPASTIAETVKFQYDDLDDLRRVFDENDGEIALVVLEPERIGEPADGYLQGLVDLAHARGALVLFDEMVTGFRWDVGGAQKVYGVTPDLSTWGKALANGYALSALAGRREVMELGGLTQTERDRVFLLSTTHAAETVGLVAAMATWDVYTTEDVIGTLHRQGARLASGLREVIASHDVGDAVSVFGRDCSLFFGTKDHEGNPSQPFRTLLLQEAVTRGLLAPNLIISYSHDDEAVDRTIEIFDQALPAYAKALAAGTTDGLLVGRPVAPVYRKRN